MKTILITAFEPFGGKAANTSAEVLIRLPDQIGGCMVKKTLLPVVFGKAAEKALASPADAVFLLGEAGGRSLVTPELKAKNLRSARIADNAGNQPADELILPMGPEIYASPFPVGSIVERMQGEGYAVAVSDDAGSFVCNDTFFLIGVRSAVPVEFIHVPAIPARADEFAETVRRFIEIALED